MYLRKMLNIERHMEPLEVREADDQLQDLNS